MGPVLGIDLGTTNSVVAVADESGVRVLRDSAGEALIPSVVSFHPRGDIVVGQRARERRQLDAKNTIYSIKRLIGRPWGSEEVRRATERFPFELRPGPTGGVLAHARGEDYALSEISAFVLREVRDRADTALGVSCQKAVVTVPANFNELQRSATRSAGRVAGLDVIRILNEPTAAALAYGYGRGSRERVAVYDFGGGTFDLTILELAGDVFEVLATAGDTFLGGDDIDTALAEQMSKGFLEHHQFDPRTDAQAFERLRVAAEWAKCHLSDEAEVKVRVEEIAYGADGASLDLAFGLKREALERIVKPLVERTFEVCEDAMRVAGIRPTQLDNVLLVGGTTRMPLVRRMVGDYFGRAPLSEVDPELVVAQGAAIQARALSPRSTSATPSASASPRSGRPLARVELKRVASGAPPPVPVSGSPHDSPTVIRPTPIPPEAYRADDVRPPVLSPEASTKKMRTLGGVAPPPVPRDPHPRPPPPALRDVPPPAPVPRDVPPPAPRHAPPPAPPLLLDVTPLTLAVETVGGYCEPIIPRNTPIPAEQSRTFSTAQDDQDVVRVQICQGESRRLSENQRLGEIELSGLRVAARGAVTIGVTFFITADGTLAVRARDLATGQEQTTRIRLIGGASEEEIERMKKRQSLLMRARE